ncbi:tRNA 2-thiouridine synthesizing protein B [Oceanisphaera litoralis]|uniref:sulfurtransferase complex subunit TusB n=1 Tax=Oceanisphaera litoralis TaxID=225144 RepID=UPI00195E675A|nr:sulfurtransferase complex subunit TusB [Oceanisphaera litoralis]MBM7455420.1 tRNA 2-thiouridine synthesizing protein B [Oceanisphaera litoralis]
MLHTVKHSPFGHQSLVQALGQLQEQDRLLLWQDAVIAATVPVWQTRLQALADSGRLYVMQEDLQARGLSHDAGEPMTGEPITGEPITMEGLVDLVVELGGSQAW